MDIENDDIDMIVLHNFILSNGIWYLYLLIRWQTIFCDIYHKMDVVQIAQRWLFQIAWKKPLFKTIN